MKQRRRLGQLCEKCGAHPGYPCLTPRMGVLSPRMFHMVKDDVIWVRFGNLEYMVANGSPARRFD